MLTILLVLQGKHGQIQRDDLGRITGNETRAKLAERVTLLRAHGYDVRATRTINGGGVRWVLVFLAVRP